MNKNIEITDLKDMLKKSGKQYGEKIAYKLRIEKNEYKQITHKEVRNMIDALGTSLINMGLKGKKIAVIGENRFEWEIAYLSIVCGTGIVVPLDKSLPKKELEELIQRSGVEAIFYSKKYEETLKNIKRGNLKYLISMDLDKSTKEIYSQKELIKTGTKLIEKGNKEFIDAKINPKEMSIMLFTSGTTSASKVVALSHKNICTNLMDIASALDVDSDDVFLSFLPLHHVFECTVGFLFSLYKGAQTVFCDGIRHIPENMKEYKISVMASVPAIYERIFKIIRKQLQKQGDLEDILKKEELYRNETMQKKKEMFKEIHNMLGGNIKLLISGAASLDAGIEQKYRDLGFNIVQGYGLTETSPVVAIGTNKNYKVGSIGKSLPSVETKLVNCNEQGIGELIVKGPSVMLGYFQNKEATDNAIIDGWFYTGDLAKIDEEGYIYICGRKKSVIVLKNGKNIFPEELENLLNKIDGVEESFVFGKQLSEDKENIKIYAKIVYNEQIVKDTYKVNSKEEIYKVIDDKVKEINRMLPRYKTIKGIILTQTPLIKTTTNKIKREKNLEKIQFLGSKTTYFEKIDSTQLEIERRIKENNIQNGEMVVAELQTNGMGTHGRTWYSEEKNNIAFSFFIDAGCKIEKLNGFTNEIAETVVETFNDLYKIKLDIKNPNDIIYNNKKLGGILTETKVSADKVKHIIVGIGINTNQEKFNKNIEGIASSIKNEFDIDVDNKKVINKFCDLFQDKLIKRIGE